MAKRSSKRGVTGNSTRTNRMQESDKVLSGERDSLPALRRIYEAHPDLALSIGDLAEHARTSWIKSIAGEQVVLREAIECKIAAMRKELLQASTNALENLLVERIVICWLQVYYADAKAAEQLRQDCLTFKQGEYAQERQGRAQRRYLSAIKALAQFRKLLFPTVQINIAQEQTNLIGS